MYLCVCVRARVSMRAPALLKKKEGVYTDHCTVYVNVCMLIMCVRICIIEVFFSHAAAVFFATRYR